MFEWSIVPSAFLFFFSPYSYRAVAIADSIISFNCSTNIWISPNIAAPTSWNHNALTQGTFGNKTISPIPYSYPIGLLASSTSIRMFLLYGFPHMVPKCSSYCFFFLYYFSHCLEYRKACLLCNVMSTEWRIMWIMHPSLTSTLYKVFCKFNILLLPLLIFFFFPTLQV